MYIGKINLIQSHYGVKNINGNEYCEMENLLDNFENPAVMDIKVLSFQISFWYAVWQVGTTVGQFTMRPNRMSRLFSVTKTI